MVPGGLGDILFHVSSDIVETLSNFKWSGSARYATHQRHASNVLTEFTGLDADKISFNIVLAAQLGVNPQAEMKKIWNYERNGQAIPLVLGQHVYGKYRWTIISHSLTAQHWDGMGNLLWATVNISLQEYLRG